MPHLRLISFVRHLKRTGFWTPRDPTAPLPVATLNGRRCPLAAAILTEPKRYGISALMSITDGTMWAYDTGGKLTETRLPPWALAITRAADEREGALQAQEAYQILRTFFKGAPEETRERKPRLWRLLPPP